METHRDPRKALLYDYWNSAPCESDAYWGRVGGTPRLSVYPPLSREYFDAMERDRYRGQPDIFGFAQFTRYHGKRVLEIGVGSGTDFLQWVRAGAEAYGVDLTETAVETTRARLRAYGLQCADLRVADAEALPFGDNQFDLVYSWGVLHHTIDTARAIAEAVRVAKPGATVKLMLYNRRSLVGVRIWVRHALLLGRPFQRVATVLSQHMESPGTKAYTPEEIRAMLTRLPVQDIEIEAAATAREFGPPLDGSLRRRLLFATRYALVVAMGLNKTGFFMKVRFDKRTEA